MKRLSIIALLLLFACKAEPDFDERYEAAEKKIRETADEIDAELESGPKEQNHAGQAEKPVASGNSTSAH